MEREKKPLLDKLEPSKNRLKPSKEWHKEGQEWSKTGRSVIQMIIDIIESFWT